MDDKLKFLFYFAFPEGNPHILRKSGDKIPKYPEQGRHLMNSYAGGQGGSFRFGSRYGFPG
jgi:hypothetical protein